MRTIVIFLVFLFVMGALSGCAQIITSGRYGEIVEVKKPLQAGFGKLKKTGRVKSCKNSSGDQQVDELCDDLSAQLDYQLLKRGMYSEFSGDFDIGMEILRYFKNAPLARMAGPLADSDEMVVNVSVYDRSRSDPAAIFGVRFFNESQGVFSLKMMTARISSVIADYLKTGIAPVNDRVEEEPEEE